VEQSTSWGCPYYSRRGFGTWALQLTNHGCPVTCGVLTWPHSCYGEFELETLRDTDKTLDKTRPVAVYCQVGYRGYFGYKILKQMRFDVVNLDGGYKSILEGNFKALQTLQEQL